MKAGNLKNTIYSKNLKRLGKPAVLIIVGLFILGIISAFPLTPALAKACTWSYQHQSPELPTHVLMPTNIPICTHGPAQWSTHTPTYFQPIKHTPHPTPTTTDSNDPTPSPTPTSSPSPTPSSTPSPTPDPTSTPTVPPTATPTPTPTASPIPIPTSTIASYSYVMTTSGSNYQILNSANTIIESSTSSSTAFNWLLGSGGHAESGSNIYVESGAYSVDSTWQININSITVTFQSGTILTAIPHSDPTNQNDVVMTLNGNNIIVSGMTINGNGLNQLPSPTTMLTGANFNNGITYSGNNITIKNCTIYNIRCFGIISAYRAGGNINTVTNCLVYNCGANAISSDPTTNTNYFVNNTIYGCSDVGISSEGLSDVVTGNNVYNCWSSYCPMYGYGNSYWGIGVETGHGTSSSYLLVTYNTLSNDGIGIWTNSGNYILISGNTLTNCNLQNYGAAIDINPNSSYNTIESNTITATSKGIAIEGSGCTCNTVYGNTFNGCSINFVNAGTGTSTSTPSQ